MPQDQKPQGIDFGQIGTNAAEGLINSGMGLLLAGHNDKRQIKQQRKLQDLQIAGQKEMALFNYEQQMKLWNDTNYAAQKAQMEKAGLNPALMYGMSGGGGATTAAATGNVSGGNAPSGGGEVMGMMGLRLQSAQAELIRAQAENLKADTENKRGIEREVAATSIDQMIQQTKSEKAKEALTKVQRDLADVEVTMKYDGYNYELDAKRYQLSESMERFNEMAMRNEITKENLAHLKEQVVNATIASRLHNELARAGINKTQEEIKQIATNIYARLRELDQTDRSLSQEDRNLAIKEATNDLIETGIWVGAASNIIGNAVDILKAGKPKVVQHKR